MQKQAKILIAVTVIILPIILIGGFFIINHYWRTIDIEIEKGDLTDVAETEEKTDEQAPEETVEPEDVPEEEVVDEELQRIIEESEVLIAKIQQFLEEEKERKALAKEAKEKSSNIKGIYINQAIANSQRPSVIAFREDIKDMLDNTELNGVVIDIKEAAGPNLPNSLKSFVDELHEKDVWVIARICVFRDSSLEEEKPELYLKDSVTTSSDNIWRDPNGIAWLDPKSAEVQEYIVEFSKQAIDFGFDELQFDYIRFPSDGELENIEYPFYDETEEKYQVIRDFFFKLSKELKDYNSATMLSVDLFGYVSTQFQAFDIGQRLFDAGETFDYISFMVYPSHFYGGFKIGEDKERGLPAINLPYESEDIETVVSNNPYQVILRSSLAAIDYLSLYGFEAKVRPWLQDFDLSFDTKRGIYYTADMVRNQIHAAEDADTSGWLLWNPSNIYTEEALEKQ